CFDEIGNLDDEAFERTGSVGHDLDHCAPCAICPDRRNPGLRCCHRATRHLQCHGTQQLYPRGRTQPVYPGAIIANHSFNGAWEWAYGVEPWMEQGLYMPVYSPYSTQRGGSIDGFKIRELFVRPHAEQHKVFW